MLKLPVECFLCQNGAEQVSSESNEKWEFDHLEVGDGIYLHLKNAKFPYKNYPAAEAVFATNMVKAIFNETLKNFKWGLVFGKKQELIDSFNRIGWKVLSPYLLKWQYTSKFARGLHYIIFTFLMRMKITEEASDRFATLFVQMIDYDNAYRLRVTDLISITNREMLLDNPRREINRIIDTIKERDSDCVGWKFIKLAKILSLLLLLPSVKKAFREAIDGADLESVQYDEIDKYWVCMRDDYKFMGLTKEQRMRYAMYRGWTYPVSF
jgi:hypothetical protein